MIHPPSIPTPSSHPRTCRICDGTGYQPAPPTHSHANGNPVTYTWSTPCTHDWFHDDNGWTEPLPLTDPRAQAALDAGIQAGRAELDAMRRDRR